MAVALLVGFCVPGWPIFLGSVALAVCAIVLGYRKLQGEKLLSNRLISYATIGLVLVGVGWKIGAGQAERERAEAEKRRLVEAGQKNKNQNPGQSDGGGASPKPQIPESQPPAKSSDKPKGETGRTPDNADQGEKVVKVDVAPENQGVKVTAADWAAYKIARAKVEADAEAKNQANQKAYEADLKKHEADLKKYAVDFERAKADLEKRMEQFREVKQEFKKDMLIYKAAKAEYEAASLMKVAREFYDAKNITAAGRRFYEIIDSYPKTQAAKDAKILANGDFVAARKMPPNPTQPFEPIEPSVIWPRLPQVPQPPQPVAVVYPPDPEAVAGAEAARRAEAALQAKEREQEEAARKAEAALQARQREQAEAARRAIEEYEVKGLVLLQTTVQGRYDARHYEITGTVVNRRAEAVTFAHVTFNIYNESGAQVSSAFATINNLEPGGRWEFKAIGFTTNGRSHKVIKLSGF